ncbi:MAG: hypothetical protein M3R72_02595 [Bacteroidota bacterium]|nr:hypothetical protein [Bacteroidota bacterium]
MNTKIKIKVIALSIIIVACFAACSKNYITGGTTQNVNLYKSTSTYDVLTKFQEFDTLVQLIDAAGLKDKINEQGTTLFAISNQSVNFYLQLRTLYLQNTVDIYAKFDLDSLTYYLKNNINHTADSMSMYLVKTITTPQNLTGIGTIYPTELAGDSAIISYEPTKDPNLGYSSIVSTAPRIVYFTQLWQHYNINGNDSTAADVPSSTGVHTLVSTSFLNTQNGVINVLTPGRSSSTTFIGTTLFFYGTRQ